MENENLQMSSKDQKLIECMYSINTAITSINNALLKLCSKKDMVKLIILVVAILVCGTDLVMNVLR